MFINNPRPKNLLGVAAPAIDFATLTSTASKTKLLDAVRFGHDLWRMQARFQSVVINAVTAVGPMGCLAGPTLEQLIRTAPSVATDQGTAADLRNAVARGVSACFAAWQSAVMVPGLPWYPSFAAFPGPMAPPTPNVPTPLVACPSAQANRLGRSSLKQAITAALTPALQVSQIAACVDALAQSLATYFTLWLPMQVVQGVLGQGPVPSYAPPVVPVGPVVGGSIISTPGHLQAGTLPRVVVV